MTGILSYEEMVRVQRANGLRPVDVCTPCAKGYCHTDKDGENPLKGKTYSDIAKLPQPLNRVCEHTKVIVPIVPAMIINEKVTIFNPDYKDAVTPPLATEATEDTDTPVTENGKDTVPAKAEAENNEAGAGGA